MKIKPLCTRTGNSLVKFDVGTPRTHTHTADILAACTREGRCKNQEKVASLGCYNYKGS